MTVQLASRAPVNTREKNTRSIEVVGTRSKLLGSLGVVFRVCLEKYYFLCWTSPVQLSYVTTYSTKSSQIWNIPYYSRTE